MQWTKSRLVSFLNRIFRPKAQPKVEIVRRFASALRMSEWRANKETVQIASKFLYDADFRMVLDCIKNEHPSQIMLLGKVSIEDRAVMQARIEGYQLCLTNLESLAVLEVPKAPLEETFADPERETQ